jgi:hypothetical protein
MVAERTVDRAGLIPYHEIMLLPLPPDLERRIIEMVDERG